MDKVLNQFVVRKLRAPADKNVDKDIEWVCNSLGFISSRDYDKTAYRIIKALVKSARKGKGLTSEELERVVEPTRGSVLYHLKKLMKSGLVVKMGSTYELKMNTLLNTVDEISKEVDMALNDIKRVAEDIDSKLGLENRQL